MASVAPRPATVARASSLRARLARDYPGRTTCVQLDYMERQLRFLLRHAVTDEQDRTFVRTTWPQIAKGVGFPANGMGAKQINRVFGSRVENTMRYLVRAGYVEGWEPVYEGREPTGILVRLARGCSSVGWSVTQAPRTRPRGDHQAPIPEASRGRVRRESHPPASSSFGHEVGSPPGGPLRGGKANVSSCRDLRTAAGARERTLSTRERALLQTDVLAALEECPEKGTREGVSLALSVHRWLAAVPAVVVLRQAVRIADREWGRHPGLTSLAISERWEQRLQRSVDQLCRVHDDPLAGIRELLVLAWGGTPEAAARRGRSPYSLGGFAPLLRKRARARRRRLGKPSVADVELERLRAKGLA